MGDYDGTANGKIMVNGAGSAPPSSPFAASDAAAADAAAAAVASAGRLEEIKAEEARLRAALERIRLEKLSTLQSRPLTMGVIGFGRFGQFIARTFAKYGRVVVTSRSNYTDIANGMGVTYVPLSNPAAFLAQDLDVIVLAVSILSFEDTVRNFVPALQEYLTARRRRRSASTSGSTTTPPPRGPLLVDVLSVKEHPRQVLLDLLPRECDILCTHPMFGPDSGMDGWRGLTFVYERTRVDGVVLPNDDDNDKEDETLNVVGVNKGHAAAADQAPPTKGAATTTTTTTATLSSAAAAAAAAAPPTASRLYAKDRVERFLSIWEEEGCHMVKMTCAHHDAFAANSQFITHLMGRVLGQQGLEPTPIDTKGFESVLKLIGSTTADSFDLFYGLYKYNANSIDTIVKLQTALDNVVHRLSEMEQEDVANIAKRVKTTLAAVWSKSKTSPKSKL